MNIYENSDVTLITLPAGREGDRYELWLVDADFEPDPQYAKPFDTLYCRKDKPERVFIVHGHRLEHVLDSVTFVFVDSVWKVVSMSCHPIFSIRLVDLFSVEFEHEIHQNGTISFIRFGGGLNGFRPDRLPPYQSENDATSIEIQRFIIGRVVGEHLQVFATEKVITAFFDRFPFIEKESEL